MNRKSKTISSKILAWVNGSVLTIMVVILLISTWMVNSMIQTATNRQISNISALNSAKMEKYLEGLLDTAVAVSQQMKELPPNTRGMAAKAFAKNFLEERQDAQGIWISFLEGEGYGGLRPGDQEAALYQVPAEYAGFEDIYYYREEGTIINGTQYTSDYVETDYYQEAMKKNTPFLSPPEVDENGFLLAALIAPIHDKQGNFIGAVGIDFNQEALAQISLVSGEFKTAFSYLVASNGLIVMESGNSSLFGKDVSTLGSQEDQFLVKTPISIGGDEESCVSVSGVSKAEILKNVAEPTIMLALVVIVFQVILFFFIRKIIRAYLKPVGEITQAAQELAKGNMNISLAVDSNDELGTLAEVFQGMAQTLKGYIQEISNLLGMIARQDLTGCVAQKYQGDFLEIETALHKILDELNQSFAQINSAVEMVATGSVQVSLGAQDLSRGSAEQASSIEALVDNISTMSSDIEQTAQKICTIQEKTEGSNLQIKQNETEMKTLLHTVQEIDRKSAEIYKIIKVIDDIAFQTNILALNAAVEAARAGTAGKGFAVVADEVRNLAEKSAEAAKDTGTLIEETLQSVKMISQQVDITAKGLRTVVNHSEEINTMVHEISEVTEKQAGSAKEIQKNVDYIAVVVQSNSAASEESAAISEELSEQAKQMKLLAESFVLAGSK